MTENVHIVSWAESADHSYENMIVLCANCHTRYDSGDIPRAAIVSYKKKLMFLNDVYSRFELDVLDYLKVRGRALVPGELLVKRLLDERIVDVDEMIMAHEFDDGDEVLGLFSVVLTDRGRQLLADWACVDDSLTHQQL